MEERRNNVELDEIKADVKEIKGLLLGNGTVGVAEMARRSFEHMLSMKASKNGMMDWAFRIAITIILTFISVRVGLK